MKPNSFFAMSTSGFAVTAIMVAGLGLATGASGDEPKKPAMTTLPPPAPPPPPPKTPRSPTQDSDEKQRVLVPGVPPVPPPPPSPSTRYNPTPPMRLPAPPPPPPRPSLDELNMGVVVDASADGKTIFLVGSLREGSFNRFKLVADKNPKATSVVLNSNGGKVFEGAVIGRYIAQRGLNTYVEGSCMSACTSAFAGGKERVLKPGARLGFHAIYNAGQKYLEDLGMAPQKPDMSFGISIYGKAFKQAGIDPSLVEKTMKVPSRTM